MYERSSDREIVYAQVLSVDMQKSNILEFVLYAFVGFPYVSNCKM